MAGLIKIGDFFQDRNPPKVIHYRMGDSVDLVKLTGISIPNLEGDFENRARGDWTQYLPFGLGIMFPLPGRCCFLFEEATSLVTLNSIYNHGDAVNAGWAVDSSSCRWYRSDVSESQIPPKIIGPMSSQAIWGWIWIHMDVAIRDNGLICRVGYDLTVKGRFVEGKI